MVTRILLNTDVTLNKAKALCGQAVIIRTDLE